MGWFRSFTRIIRTVFVKVPLALFSGNGQEYQKHLMIAYALFMLFFVYNVLWAVFSPTGGLTFYLWKFMYGSYYHQKNLFYNDGSGADLSLMGQTFALLEGWGSRKSAGRKFPIPIWMDQEDLVLVRECVSFDDCNHSESEILISFKCKKTDDKDVSIPVHGIEHKKIDKSHCSFFYHFNPVEIGNKKNDHCSKELHTYLASMYHSSFRMNFDIFSHPTLPGIASTNDADATAAIHIGVVSDNQYQFYRFQTILDHLSKHRLKNSLDLMIHLGDAVQEPRNLQQWQTDFFDPITITGMYSVPWILVHGNHDYMTSQEPFYKPKKSYYTLLLPHNTHVTILDSNLKNDDEEAQFEWFKNSVLDSDSFIKARFRIVLVHIPPYIEYWDPKTWTEGGESKWNEIIRTNYAPLFERHHVQLVLSGHQHNYQRGTRAQVLYVITGGAGGNLDREMVESYGFYDKTVIDHHYLILTIDPKAITGKVYSFSNRKIDEWKIKPIN